MIIFLIVWVLCGLFAIYLAGKADKILGYDAGAPLFLLFVMGPFGILAGIVYILIELYLNKAGRGPLEKIRDLGRK